MPTNCYTQTYYFVTWFKLIVYCRMLYGVKNTFVYKEMCQEVLTVIDNIQVLHLTPVSQLIHVCLIKVVGAL